MVESPTEALIVPVVDVMLAHGEAILDTGCTTSVVGTNTAAKYAELMTKRGIPPPEPVELPPVELRGFDGQKTRSTAGLRWTVRLGKLWGNVTTYTIPGDTPFLLSRRVLEGMKASIDLGNMTITSEKHGMHQEPLRQATNGHLLLPLCDVHVVSVNQKLVDPEPAASECVREGESNTGRDVTSQPGKPRSPSRRETAQKPSTSDRRRALQHIAKNTKSGTVQVDVHRDELATLYGKSLSCLCCI